MSKTTINRIAGVLHREFDSLIDMSDWKSRPPSQIESAFLSRALAALCVKKLASVTNDVAASSVVDGYNDGGIDAIHFDATSDTLILVQSKWSGSGNPCIREGEASKFVNGCRNLLAADFENFNSKVQEKTPELLEILYAGRDIRMRLATVHTSTQPIAPHVSRVIDSFTNELNDPVRIASHIDIDQTGVYELITAESKDPKITLQAVLNDWGLIERPFVAYYGRVGVNQIIQWWNEHRNRLFSQNLRLYYQNSNVNDALQKTLNEDPESFWYFNNGITIISEKIIKGLAGSPAHKFGNFTLEGASVVNGAQTVGTIGSVAELHEIADTDEPPAWVQVRLISLEKCPPNFGTRLTRAANLQNAVGSREFAAMDPLQHKLAVEFALDKRRYVYKSGEQDPKGDEGCGIVEATQALGCAHSTRVAVDVKREIGSLWSDTDRAPYIEIFDKNLTAERVWRAVCVMRAVDAEIQKLRSSAAPRADMVGVHMNRIILHLVFRDQSIVSQFHGNTDLGNLTKLARETVQPIFNKVAAYLEDFHDNEYLASLCKNHAKCDKLVNVILSPTNLDPKQGNLFS